MVMRGGKLRSVLADNKNPTKRQQKQNTKVQKPRLLFYQKKLSKQKSGFLQKPINKLLLFCRVFVDFSSGQYGSSIGRRLFSLSEWGVDNLEEPAVDCQNAPV